VLYWTRLAGTFTAAVLRRRQRAAYSEDRLWHCCRCNEENNAAARSRKCARRARELRPNAGVGWLQRAAVGQAGPVLANGGIKALGAARVDIVVDRIDPLDVGPEAPLAAKIERQMDAEPG
jgi:hypothetical protein